MPPSHAALLVQALIEATLRSVRVLLPSADSAAAPSAQPSIDFDSDSGGLLEIAKWEAATQYVRLQTMLCELQASEAIELGKVRARSQAVRPCNRFLITQIYRYAAVPGCIVCRPS